MSTIRVGFIGCGGNASGHVGRILAMGECEVVGLCDLALGEPYSNQYSGLWQYDTKHFVIIGKSDFNIHVRYRFNNLFHKRIS